MIVAAPLERRREQFLTELLSRIDQLDAQGRLNARALADRGAFTDTLLRANAAATQTHQEEKRARLRNVVLNAALRPDPQTFREERERARIVDAIAELSVWHISILSRFNDIERGGRNVSSTPRKGRRLTAADVVCMEFSNISDTQLALELWRELFELGLVTHESGIILAGSGLPAFPITDRGRALLDLVSEPSVAVV